MKNIFRFFTVALLLCCAGSAFAQTASQARRDDTQLWTDVELQVALDKKKTVDLIFTGTFRLGRNVSHPIDERGGAAIAFKINKYFTFTPGYLYQAAQPVEGRKSYESRLRFDGTIKIPLGRFTISDRNMIERRIRNSRDDSTRYRNRLKIETPVKLGDVEFNLFVSDEIFYDWTENEWVRNRFSVGASKKLAEYITGELYYMRQNDGISSPGDLHVIGTALKIRLR